MNKLDLNAKAESLRKELEQDITTPLDVFSLVDKIPSLTLVYYPFDDNISGICVKTVDYPLIAINSRMSYGRQRFSLAHELYHLKYDASQGYTICSKDFSTNNEIEREADQFASYFLAPYKDFKDIVDSKTKSSKLSIEMIIEIEQLFEMSHLAVLYRLKEEKYINKSQYDDFSKRNVSGLAMLLGYDTKLYKPTLEFEQRRTFGQYIKWTEQLRAQNNISEGKINELLLEAFRDDIVFGYNPGPGGDIID